MVSLCQLRPLFELFEQILIVFGDIFFTYLGYKLYTEMIDDNELSIATLGGAA